VAALHGLYICSFIDRQLIGVLVTPMKRDLHLSDTTIGLVQGVGFAVLYSLVGLPLGRLVDRFSRKWIIGAGVLVWSAMTALSGFAQNTATLLVARSAVGVGEAALSPSAYSMIADLFPKNTLGRALSVYALGSVIGGGLAVIVGGLLVRHFDGRPPVAIPGVGHIFAWQLTYLLVGLPGLALAAVFLLTVREPARRDRLLGQGQVGGAGLTLREALGFMRTRWQAYTLLFGGHAFYTLAGYAGGAWMPTFFQRTYGWDMGRVAETYGVVGLLSGLVGPVLAGWVADHLYAKGDVDSSVRLSGYTLFVAAAFGVMSPLAGSPSGTLWLMAIGNVLTSFLQGLPLASIQIITPNELRGQVSALFLFVVNMVGIGLGATSVGFVTDHVFGYDGAVKYSLAIVPPLSLLIGGVMLLFCCRAFLGAYALSKAWTEPALQTVGPP
jgi:MFS family permease